MAERVEDIMRTHGQVLKNGRRTIFHDLWNSPELPESDRTRNHMINEGQTIIGGGASTTAGHLTITTYHLLSNPEMLKRLQDELRPLMTNQHRITPLSSLEKLPYLTAIIHEGHRHAIGVGHRSPRVSPHLPIQYKQYKIPPRTPVGMSNWLIAVDETIFPDRRAFRPERFLSETDGSENARKLFNPFSRGTWSCQGQNLAQAELYAAFAAVFGSAKFQMELYETDAEDVEVARDYFAVWPKKGARGLRVLVK